MLKKYTMEYFKASEVNREAKLPAYWKCCFAEDIEEGNFAILYLHEAAFDYTNDHYADDIKVQNNYDWMKYFYDFGYRDEVRILIDY